MAEAVFQFMRGNFGRVGGCMDADLAKATARLIPIVVHATQRD